MNYVKEHTMIDIYLSKISYSYMAIESDGKSQIQLVGAIYNIDTDTNLSKAKIGTKDIVNIIRVDKETFEKLASYGQFFLGYDDNSPNAHLFVNDNTFSWLRDGLKKHKREFFKDLSLRLWTNLKIDKSSEKYWVESFTIVHTDGQFLFK